MKKRYIGESCVPFENGRIYEIFDEMMSDVLGNFYCIIDESGEWYRYSEKYVERNFEMNSKEE